MPSEYQQDGDIAFLGLNSRDNPSVLPSGYVTKSSNFRLDRGIATTRKGLKKFSEEELYGETKTVVGSGTYLNSNGQEIIMILIHDSDALETKLYEFNPDTGLFGSGKLLPVDITSSDGVDMIQAVDKVFITRGHNARPIMWNMSNTFTVLPTSGTGNEFPNCTGLMFYQNRLVATGHHKTMADIRARDTVCVSHYLEWDKWPSLDAFTINQGGNDEIVSVVPWTMNEFLILCRNSTFYLNVGTSKYASGEALAQDARLESLSVDIGCMAKRSSVQVGNGVMFLSDNGVYMLTPVQSGAPDGVKLLTLSEPISAPIDDVVRRINRTHAKDAVAAYWNNRYYLAVPLDNSTKNNAVLVYNFILKNWESIDTYPEDIDILAYSVAKRDKQRRLFIIDSNEGILLTEEGSSDELGTASGSPYLNQLGNPSIPYEVGKIGARLNWLLSETAYTGTPIYAELITRRFIGSTSTDKRFSSVDVDIYSPNGGLMTVSAITNNPDTDTLVDIFSLNQDEDVTRRNPIRKIAYGLQVKYNTYHLQPSIRSTFIKFTMQGKHNINRQ